MVIFTRERRAYFGDKVGDVANLAAGALVFGQSLSAGEFSIRLVLAGFTAWLLLLVCGAWLIRNGGPS